MYWECPERKKEGGEDFISEAHKRYVEAEGAEDGRSLMMNTIILKLEPEVENPVQRKNFVQDIFQD
jgi:hypothetical protein